MNDDLSALADMGMKITRGTTWLRPSVLPATPRLPRGSLGMRLQKDASGNPVDSAPKYILAPPALEVTSNRATPSRWRRLEPLSAAKWWSLTQSLASRTRTRQPGNPSKLTLRESLNFRRSPATTSPRATSSCGRKPRSPSRRAQARNRVSASRQRRPQLASWWSAVR